MVDSLKIYKSYYDAINQLPDAERPKMWAAIFEYVFEGKEQKLTGVHSIIWTIIKPNIDSSIRSYIEGKNGGKKSAKERGVSKGGSKGGYRTNVDIDKDKDKNVDIDMDIEKLIKDFSDKYPVEMLKSFHNYWTECDAKGMARWKKQPTWETSRRLATWQSNYLNRLKITPKEETRPRMIDLPSRPE